MNRFALGLAGFCLLQPLAHSETADQRAVRELETEVALVLTRQGFDAYAAHFHPDYSNWTGRGAPIGRAEFLVGVKAWHAAGNHAVAVALQPISFEVFGDVALSRYRLREDFKDGTSFVGRFNSLAKREGGRWLLFRTQFETEYQGETAKALHSFHPQLLSPLWRNARCADPSCACYRVSLHSW